MDEKMVPRYRRKFNPVGFCLAGIRIWQWSSAFFIYASFSLLYANVSRNKLGESNRMKVVEILGLVSLSYTTLVICGVHICKTLGLRLWRPFAVLSLAGDLAMMGTSIAKMTTLSIAGLPADCHGLTRDNYVGNDLIRQPADGYNTIRFGSWTASMTGELDSLCNFPRTVYGLSVVAIFSYTFTLVLSVLYLQQPKQEVNDSEKIMTQPNSPRHTLHHMSHHMASSIHAPSILDLDIDSSPPSPRLSSRSSSPHHTTQTHSTRSSRAPSTSSSWGGITLGTSGSSSSSDDAGSIRSGGSLPPPPVPGSSAPAQRRWSTSTSSSFNANAFIVTDGFRPEDGGDRPPAYESRPGSLYNETMKYPAGLGMPGTPKP